MGMLKKIFWVGIGVAVGWVWGFLSLKSLVDRARNKFAPATIAESAVEVGGKFSRRLGDAVKLGIEDARKREMDLRESLEYRRRRAG